MQGLAEFKAQLGIGPCHLVGQCEGGVVAADYAAKYPVQVRSLVTSSTQCFSEVPMTELNAIKFTKAFSELDPELRAKFLDWHGEKNAEASFNQFRLYGGAYGKDYFDLRNTLRSVTCPSLVIYPDRSFIFDVEQGVAFYKHLPYGRAHGAAQLRPQHLRGKARRIHPGHPRFPRKAEIPVTSTQSPNLLRGLRAFS